MKFINAILFALTATVTNACGSGICADAIAERNAECPLDCMWGPCTKYDCPQEAYDMICGKNKDSCAKI
ncbi:hypothetical protein FDECE_11827 [Fusarium decemcellulare]|nr:hypothetical protein FDECE_11827 [Fusarium decemcellulare]